MLRQMLWGGHKKLGGPTVFLNDGILLKGRLHMELGCFLFSNCSLELQRLSTNSREAAQLQLKGFQNPPLAPEAGILQSNQLHAQA